MSDPEKPEVSAKPRRDPAALTSEYHKAHKQVMLWATILLIWELIGVDLGKAKDAGGNIGPIVTALKSPQAVPWALTGLVVYFLFKCSVEWAQCHPERRKIRFARADYVSAWIVAVSATLLYAAQAASRMQLADLVLNSRRAQSMLVGILSGMALMLNGSLIMIQRATGKKFSEVRAMFIGLAVGSLFFISLGVFILGAAAHTLLGVVIGALIGAVLTWVSWTNRRWAHDARFFRLPKN